MAKPVQQIVQGVSVSGVVGLDYQTTAPFNVSLWVEVGDGCTYTIELTCDNIQDPEYDPSAGFWLPHPDATDLTVDCAVAIAFPATAARLNQTVGAENSSFTVIQQGLYP